MTWSNQEKFEYVMSPYTVPPIAMTSILKELESGLINENGARTLIDYYIEQSDSRFRFQENIRKLGLENE